MFGMGMPEILLILAIALVVIGPKKLPDLAKAMGRALGEFKRATNELKASIDIDPGLKDVKNAFNGINDELKDAVHSATEGGGSQAPEQERGADTAVPPKDDEKEPADGYQEALEKVKAAFRGNDDVEASPNAEKTREGEQDAPSAEKAE